MPEILDNIVNAESKKKKENEELLDLAPDVDLSLLDNIEAPKNIHLVIFKSLFAILMFVVFVAFVFFRSQLSSTFSFMTSALNLENASEHLKEQNQEILSLKTAENYYKYLQVNAHLNEFSYFGDAFTQNYENIVSQTASNEMKDASNETIKSLRNNIQAIFTDIKSLMESPYYITLIDPELSSSTDELKTLYNLELSDRLATQASQIANSEDEYKQREHKNFVQTMKLVANDDLRNTIINTDIAEMSDEDLYHLIKNVNKLIVNDLSVIQEIKSNRIKWSDIMNEIDRRTMEVDSTYSEHYYDLKGGIRYSSYDFDKSARSISIVGEILRYDTNNFTMLANLLDVFNSSDIFGGASMSSFSKSGSVDSGYRSSVRLKLDLLDNI